MILNLIIPNLMNNSYNTRVAILKSKSQSKSRFSSLEVKLADVIIKALAFFKGVVAWECKR